MHRCHSVSKDFAFEISIKFLRKRQHRRDFYQLLHSLKQTPIEYNYIYW